MKRSKKINYGEGSITPTAYGTFSAYLRREGRALRASVKDQREVSLRTSELSRQCRHADVSRG